MGRDPEHPYRELIDHPVQEIDGFLLDYELEDDWVGIVGGPQHDGDDVLLVYNVRSVDGPYQGKIGADFRYRLTGDVAVDAPEIYRQQIAAIETAFPDVTVQCYQKNRWAVDR